jgi:hypothetical protein
MHGEDGPASLTPIEEKFVSGFLVKHLGGS